MEICRACLSTGDGMVAMDENFVNKYNLLTNLNITLTEMPLYICDTCSNGVAFCIEFREKCITSDLALNKILFRETKHAKSGENDNDGGRTTIKEEIKEEYYETEFLDECYNKDDELKNVKKHMHKRNIKKEKLSTDSKLHCGLCPKKLADKNELAHHLKRHEMDVACTLCPQRFANVPHLLGHRMDHVPKNQKACHICSKKFISAANLEYHYMRVHEMAEKDAPIQCKKCLKLFQNVKKLIKHSYAHAELTFSCELCAKTFKNISSLKIHMGKHGKPAFKCDLCEYVSKYRAGIRSHKLRKHTASKVYCKTCVSVFASKETLAKHECKRRFGVICPVCGVNIRSSSSTQFKLHMLTHTDVHQYKCDACPAKFKTKCNYNAHIDKHAGSPRFRCEHCARAFYSQPALIKHRRTHTGEKPYVCDICSRGFTGNYNLKVHMKVHGIFDLIKTRNSIDR